MVHGQYIQQNDTNSTKARLKQEKFDLQHQVQELDFANAALANAKSQLQVQNEDPKMVLDDDRMQRQNLQVQLSKLQADYDNLSHRYDEESEAASTLRTQLSKVNAEFAALKARFEKELMAKTEELEELRHTVRTKRLAVGVDPCDTLRQMNDDLEENIAIRSAQLDQCFAQLKLTQNDVQNLTIRYRDDLQSCNGNLQLTNEKLSDEVEALRDAEAKLAAAQASLAQLQTEMEYRLRDKDEEIEYILEESDNKIEHLQTSYVNGYNLLYAEIRELKGVLDNVNKSNSDYLKQIRELQQRVKELEVLLEEARLNNTNEEDLRTRLDVAERARKNAENEVDETSARLSEIQIQVTALTNDKRRMEANITAMQSDLEDAINVKRAAEERADRFGNENMRLAHKLMIEQKNYKNAEIEIHKLNIRLEDAEASAAYSVRSIVARLRTRVPSLY